MSTLEQPTIFKAFCDTASQESRQDRGLLSWHVIFLSQAAGPRGRFAAALAGLGIKKGDRIVMYIPNSIQFVVSWLGIQRLGAVAVPITPIYTSFDLKYIASDTGAKAVVCPDRNYGYVKQAMADTAIKQVVVTNLADLLPWWKRAFGMLADKVPAGKVEKAPFISFMKTMVSSSNPPAPDPESQAEDESRKSSTLVELRNIPKECPSTHGLFLVSADEQLAVRDPLFPKDQDVIVGGAPLFHILGQTCSLVHRGRGRRHPYRPATGESRRDFRFHTEAQGHDSHRRPRVLPHDSRTRPCGPV